MSQNSFKECVAVLTVIYKKNGAVSDLIFSLTGHFTLPELYKQHAPWSVGRYWSSLATHLD